MVVVGKRSSPGWLLRTLQRLKGLQIRQDTRSSSIHVFVNGSAPAVFEVRYFPVLSRERATELIKGEALPQSGKRILLATRRLAEPTRELLREAGISWVEQLTGVCRLVSPGLLVEATANNLSQKGMVRSVRARLRQRSGLIAEVLLQAPHQNRVHARDLVHQTGLSGGLVEPAPSSACELERAQD